MIRASSVLDLSAEEKIAPHFVRIPSHVPYWSHPSSISWGLETDSCLPHSSMVSLLDEQRLQRRFACFLGIQALVAYSLSQDTFHLPHLLHPTILMAFWFIHLFQSSIPLLQHFVSHLSIPHSFNFSISTYFSSPTYSSFTTIAIYPHFNSHTPTRFTSWPWSSINSHTLSTFFTTYHLCLFHLCYIPYSFGSCICYHQSSNLYPISDWCSNSHSSASGGTLCSRSAITWDHCQAWGG